MAKITTQSALPPFVMKHFVPFSTHAVPSLRHVVRMPATSLPAPGSVSPYAPYLMVPGLKMPKKRSFCSLVPMKRMGGPPSPGPGKFMITPASPQLVSSAPMMANRLPCLEPRASVSSPAPSPSPPIGLGMTPPPMPMSTTLRRNVSGTACSRSDCNEIGRISYSANQWIISRRFFCVAV